MNQLSGYIEIDLVPFKFGTNAWALFCDKHGVDLDEISKTGIFGEWDKDGKLLSSPKMLVVRELYYFAHVAASRSAGKSAMNEYQFGDWLDERADAMKQLQDTMLRGKILGYDMGDKDAFRGSR